MKPYTVLVADPPLAFGDKLPGKGRGAEKHYNVLSLAEIVAFDIPKMADDSWLFLWRVAAMQTEALAVAKAWGFRVDSEIVWVKSHGLVGASGDGTQLGMGRTVRNCHEVCLVCRRGKPLRASASVRSVIVAPRGKHSAKPDLFFEQVEKLVGPTARKAEIFARVHRDGWACFGDELSAALAAE